MTILRSIPILLYLLMVVVLPYAPLISHAHEHPVEQDQPAHDSCALCQLLTQPAQTSETDVLVQPVLLWTTAVAISIPKPERFQHLSCQARAPPLMTA